MYGNYTNIDYSGSPSSTDYSLILQPTKEIFCKIEILDTNYQITAEISGNVIDFSCNEDSSSDIRRTATLNFIPNGSFDFKENGAIWFNKNIRIKIGYLKIPGEAIVWYPFGTYVFDSVSSIYDASSNTLTVNCVDLCSRLNGDHGGMIPAKSIEIEEGISIYNVVSEITKNCPYITDSKIIIEKVAMTDENNEIYYDYPIIPYDLEFQEGTTWLQILSSIRDLYAGYEFYFEDTTFVYRPIDTDEYSPVVISNDYLEKVKISENVNSNLKEVKNVTEVWGSCYDLDHFSTSTEFEDKKDYVLYTLTTDSISELTNGIYVGFKAPESSNTEIKILIKTSNGVWLTGEVPEGGTPEDAIPLEVPLMKYEGAGYEPHIGIVKDESYVIQYRNKKFLYMGHHQISAVVKLMSQNPSEEQKSLDKINYPVSRISYIVDPSSKFSVEKIGERLDVLSGGDYSSIYSEDLAEERAKYENWKKSELLDTISLSSISIPFLHVNQKIEYKSKNDNIPMIYDVLSLSHSIMDGTVDISIKKHKGNYPWK